MEGSPTHLRHLDNSVPGCGTNTKKKKESIESKNIAEQTIYLAEKTMKDAAAQLEFEKAAILRDQIKRLREQQLMVG